MEIGESDVTRCELLHRDRDLDDFIPLGLGLMVEDQTRVKVFVRNANTFDNIERAVTYHSASGHSDFSYQD